MNTYEYEYWYRHGNEQEDFATKKVDALTESEAFLKVRETRKLMFGIKLISINGINVEP